MNVLLRFIITIPLILGLLVPTNYVSTDTLSVKSSFSRQSSYGKLLHKFREAKGWSKEELAARTKLTIRIIQDAEKGDFSDKSILLILSALQEKIDGRPAEYPLWSAEKIKEERNKKGWSKEELARRTRLMRHTIINVEKGKTSNESTIFLNMLALQEKIDDRPIVWSAEKIKEERNKKGWSLEELAARTKLTKGTIFNVEKGKTSKEPTIFLIMLALQEKIDGRPTEHPLWSAEKIKEERNKKGWSLEELAARTKLTKGTILRIEKGDSIGDATIFLIMLALQEKIDGQPIVWSAEKIKEERNKKGWSLEKLATRTKLTQRTVLNVEKGDSTGEATIFLIMLALQEKIDGRPTEYPLWSAKRIKEERNKKGWSKDELARRTRLTRPTIVNVEKGDSIGDTTIFLIMSALQEKIDGRYSEFVSPNTLFLRDPKPGLHNKENKIYLTDGETIATYKLESIKETISFFNSSVRESTAVATAI